MVILTLIIVGLILGSFINALVWRIHKQATNKKNKQKYSIATGRSQCVHCGHLLHAKDLVPVLSWVSLGGKCRYCGKAVSWQYPVVELLTAGAFVVSYLAWPAAFTAQQIVLFMLWLIIVVQLIALMVYDFKWKLLPDRVVLPLTICSAIFVIVSAINPLNIGLIISAAMGAVVLAGLFWALFEVSKGNWIGGGDVKLAVALGLLAGSPVKALLLLFIASLIGTIGAMPLLVTKKAGIKAKLAFGPLLIIATFIVFFWGQPLIDWYVHRILLY